MTDLAIGTANVKIFIANVGNNYTWVCTYTAWLIAQTIVKMSILKYFKRSSNLPDPEGPLSKELDSYTIRLVNEKVKPEIEKSQHCERGPYVKLMPSQKAFVGKRATEHGVTATIRHFSGRYEGCDLKETTVCRFKKESLLELRRKRQCGEDDVPEVPAKKRGHPLLLGEELDGKMKLYPNAMRSRGAV